MLNFQTTAWVKNVNNQRTQTGINSVLLSTKKAYHHLEQQLTSEQLQLTHHTLLFFTQSLSTYKILFFNLLNTSYTHNPQHLLIERINEN
jgi:hypothetical protein